MLNFLYKNAFGHLKSKENPPAAGYFHGSFNLQKYSSEMEISKKNCLWRAALSIVRLLIAPQAQFQMVARWDVGDFFVSSRCMYACMLVRLPILFVPKIHETPAVESAKNEAT